MRIAVIRHRAGGQFAPGRIAGRQIEVNRLDCRIRCPPGKIEPLLGPSRKIGFVAVPAHL